MRKKVIITAAVTGGIHTPGMTPYLPITPEEIIDDALKAYEAGATVVHIHGRNPETGMPTSDLDIIAKIVDGIKRESDLAICITTGGGMGMTLEERIAVVPAFKPDLASCNAGSINFVLTRASKRLTPKFEWEKKYLESTYDLVFTNTYKGIEYYVNTMNKNATLPEFEIYDVGMINNIAYFKSEGVITQPIYLQFVMGIQGGIPATIENMLFMLNEARRLIGDFNWSVCAGGRHQIPMTTAALLLGGNVRVGLEDSIFIGPGKLAKSSAEQVTLIKEIAEKLNIEIANSSETREILGLKDD